MSDFKYTLSIAIIMKYENPYVVEFIEYHHLIGVDHFYIFDNDENSGLPELLDYYIDNGLVTLIHFPGEVRMFSAYNTALKSFKSESKYIAYIDTDEFLVTNTPEEPISITIDNLFNKYGYNNTAAIGINWRMFGTSNHETKPEGLIIENYTMYGNVDEKNRHIKSIVNPRLTTTFYNPHHGVYFNHCKSVDQNGNRIYGPFNDNYMDNYSPLRIHHYAYKSRKECLFRVKRKKCDINISDTDIKKMVNEWLANEDEFNKYTDTYVKDTYTEKVKENMINHGYNPKDGQKL